MSLPDLGLHGRDADAATLRAALDRVVSGGREILSIEGEAGIGKTRLLAETLDAGRAIGLQVLHGRVEEQERTRPFGLWIDVLRHAPSSVDSRRASIAALLAPRTETVPITVTSDPGLQFQVVDSVVDLVEELAGTGPLVIGLDDLQWADASSLLTMTAVARRLSHSALALITCRRTGPRSEDLRRSVAALDAAGGRSVRLHSLSDQAVRDLVVEILGAEPSEELLAKVSGAGGNPLFVVELVAALIGDGEVEDAEQTVVRGVDGLRSDPPSLGRTILRHLSFLPDATLRALRTASILGTSLTIPDLVTTTGRSVLDLSAALGPALTAGVLVDDGEQLRFRHDLVRDALYTDIPQTLRRGLHREAGARLARTGAGPLQVAEQVARGTEQGDEDAIRWLSRAAREVAPRSPDVAAELLGRALDLTDPASPGHLDRDRLEAERASSLWWAGDLAAARRACRALLGRVHEPEVDEPARICLALTLIAEGRMADALGELERVRQVPAPTPAAQAAAWGWASMAHGSLGDLDAAEAAAVEAQATAPADAHVTISLALNSLAAVAEHRGRPGRALAIIDDAVRRADRSPDSMGHRYPIHVTRGHILMELDRLADARTSLQTGRRLSETLGTRWTLSSIETFLAVEQFLSGQWDDAVAGIESALELAEETGEHYSLVLAHSVLALIALHRGDLPEATESVERAHRELTLRGPRFRSHWVDRVRGLLLEAAGDLPGAFTLLAACWDDCSERGFAIELPVLGPDLVRLALAIGDRARAAEVATAVADLAGASDVAWHRATALRCQGLVAGDPAQLRAAVDVTSSSSRLLEFALTAEDAAGVEARSGAADAARELLGRALVTFERLGATRDVDRVEASLRLLGVRRGRRGRRSRPRFGWDGLTPTERRVVDLVVEGLTNPQIGDRLFLSRRTVQTHLTHVFAKVGVSTRAQLAAQAAGHAARQRDGARG